MPTSAPSGHRPVWPKAGHRLDAFPPTPAPAPTEIPLCWLSSPVQLRLELPYTSARISVTGGGVYPNASAANVAEYGDYAFTAELATRVPADAVNLAHWTITYRSTPRMRSPQLAINLLYLSDAEKIMLLRIARWSRIKLTGVPPEFPASAASLVVAGMKHQMSVKSRMLYITTAPVIGVNAATPGPWFRYGSSAWGGSDIIPF